MGDGYTQIDRKTLAALFQGDARSIAAVEDLQRASFVDNPDAVESAKQDAATAQAAAVAAQTSADSANAAAGAASASAAAAQTTASNAAVAAADAQSTASDALMSAAAANAAAANAQASADSKLDPTTAAATYAPLVSPALSGNPTAPTPATNDNDTSIATTAFVKNQGYLPAGNLQRASSVVTTNGSGKVAITFPTPFSGVPVVFVCNGDGGVASNEFYSLDGTSITATGFVAIIANASGPLASVTRRMNWIAVL